MPIGFQGISIKTRRRFAGNLFALACWLYCPVMAQPFLNPSLSYRVNHLSVENGLSQSQVNCILQDKAGYIWFGTDDGLNRYDGISFTVFQPDPTDPNSSLAHNIISDLHEDHWGNLWLTTLGGQGC